MQTKVILLWDYQSLHSKDSGIYWPHSSVSVFVISVSHYQSLNLGVCKINTVVRFKRVSKYRAIVSLSVFIQTFANPPSS